VQVEGAGGGRGWAMRKGKKRTVERFSV
jgi:hypothetical protein